MKNKNKGFIITIIILVVLLIVSISFLWYGYTEYDNLNKDYKDLHFKYNDLNKKLKDTNKRLEEESNSANKNAKYEFDLSKVKCSNANELSCVKDLDIRYNNENHSIRIESSIEKVDNDQMKVTYKIYDNNQLLQTIKGGIRSIIDSGSVKGNWNFDGFTYVFDSKYLGFVLPDYDGRRGYDATFITSEGKLIKKINVELAWTGFGTENNSDLDSISNLEFDGHMLKVWDLNCDGDGAVQVGITIDKNSLVFKKMNKISDITVGGGEVHGGCKFSKENIE